MRGHQQCIPKMAWAAHTKTGHPQRSLFLNRAVIRDFAEKHATQCFNCDCHISIIEPGCLTGLFLLETK